MSAPAPPTGNAHSPYFRSVHRRPTPPSTTGAGPVTRARFGTGGGRRSTDDDTGDFQPTVAPAGFFEFDRSAFGLRDVAGNAAEWCAGPELPPAAQPIRGGCLVTKSARGALLHVLATSAIARAIVGQHVRSPSMHGDPHTTTQALTNTRHCPSRAATWALYHIQNPVARATRD